MVETRPRRRQHGAALGHQVARLEIHAVDGRVGAEKDLEALRFILSRSQLHCLVLSRGGVAEEPLGGRRCPNAPIGVAGPGRQAGDDGKSQAEIPPVHCVHLLEMEDALRAWIPGPLREDLPPTPPDKLPTVRPGWRCALRHRFAARLNDHVHGFGSARQARVRALT
jgi:hypothetical protein